MFIHGCPTRGADKLKQFELVVPDLQQGAVLNTLPLARPQLVPS